MKRLVSIILNFMIKNNVISKDTEEIEFYRYGIEITLSSLINIALISIIGIVTNYTFESTMWFCQYHLTHFIRTRIMQRERYDHSRAFFGLPEAAHRWRCRFFC